MKDYIKKYYLESICLVVIIIFSLINMLKAHLLNESYSDYLIKQSIWYIVGIILFIYIHKIKFKKIFKYRYVMYLINILLLIYVLLFSKSTNGIKAWIKIGPISLQPSELIKITFPLCVIKPIKEKRYLFSFIIFIIPSLLILLEPDTGNMVLLLFLYLYLLSNKNTKKYIIILLLLITIAFVTFILIYKYYPKLIINLFNGTFYYRFKRIFSINNNYQISNALIGIGSASLLPIGINKLQIYIPEGITDFILTFSICNYGILLNMFLILSYIVFITKMLYHYKKGLYYLKKKIIGSFIVIFIVQSIYNIFMNIGLVPIMGIPLPFLSYGGSNIITYFILFALATKKISSIEDKDNNNYKNNYHKVLVDKNS